MSIETLSSVPTIGAEIASASIQSVLPIAESGISFDFNPSIGAEIAPSIIGSPSVSVENIFDLPVYKPNFDLGITSISPELSVNFQTFKPDEFDLEPLDQPIQTQDLILYPVAEEEANTLQLQSALKTLQSFGFSQEEEQTWANKLKNAAQKKQVLDDEPVNKPETVVLSQIVEEAKQEVQPIDELDSQTDTAIQTETETETESAGAPPIAPPKMEFASFYDEEDKAEEKKKTAWEVIRVEKHKQLAKDSLEKRISVAKDIVKEAAGQEPGDIENAVEAKLYKLDTPDVIEFARIIKGDLDIPAVAHILSAKLTISKGIPDIEQIDRTIKHTLFENSPKEKVEKPKPAGIIEEEQLPEEAKKLAEQGAEVIALRKKSWTVLNKPAWKDPIEFDKKAA